MLTTRAQGALVSGVFIIAIIIVALISSIFIHPFQLSSELKYDITRVSYETSEHMTTEREPATTQPNNMYWKYIQKITPTTIGFPADPAFPDQGFVSCPRADSRVLFLICCPDRGTKDYLSIPKFTDIKEDPPINVTRLYLLNNCFEPIYFGCVGTNVPVKLNGLKLENGDITFIDIAVGADLTIFTRSQCIPTVGIRGKNTLRCKDADCFPNVANGDGLGCAKSPFTSSEVTIKIDLEGNVTYRTSNINGFNMEYSLSVRGNKCKTSGGSFEYNHKEMLELCPDSLTFKDPYITRACMSQCKACHIEETVKNCQCHEDIDCRNCTPYWFTLDPNSSEVPLVCDQSRNRCTTNFVNNGNQCDSMFKSHLGSIAYKDIYCCSNPRDGSFQNTPNICLHLNTPNHQST